MSINPRKPSPIRLRQIFRTIEKICAISNPDETNPALNDIYRIAHAFSCSCPNPHEDWILLAEELEKKLAQV